MAMASVANLNKSTEHSKNARVSCNLHIQTARIAFMQFDASVVELLCSYARGNIQAHAPRASRLTSSLWHHSIQANQCRYKCLHKMTLL